MPDPDVWPDSGSPVDGSPSEGVGRYSWFTRFRTIYHNILLYSFKIKRKIDFRVNSSDKYEFDVTDVTDVIDDAVWFVELAWFDSSSSDLPTSS